MCGLGGYIGKPLDEDTTVRNLIVKMGVRGRDGFGVVAHNPSDNKTVMFKRAVAISEKTAAGIPDLRGSTAVVMHTRAATSGTHGVIDCHPLLHKGIVVAHNGMVNDDDDLRKELGIPDDTPQVDSFLIAWLIGEAANVVDGIRKVFTTLSGSLTFLVFTKRAPSTIWAASNCGNLYQFKHRGQDFLCSTQNIFEEATTIKRGGLLYKGGFKMSTPLDGIWELSPHRFHQVAKLSSLDLAVSKKSSYLPPKTRYSYQGGEYHTGATSPVSLRPQVHGSERPSRGGTMVSRTSGGQSILIARSLEAISQEFPRLARRGLIHEIMAEVRAEHLDLRVMKQIVKAVDDKIILPLKDLSQNCEANCDRKARCRLDGDDSYKFCWTCTAKACEWIPDEEGEEGERKVVH